MPNTFLGFPVPRAKIAEMIETTAPPSLHISQHRPPGTDPIALPEDIAADQLLKWNGTKFIGDTAGAGGMTNLYDGAGLFWQCTFETIDYLNPDKSINGDIGFSNGHLYMSVGMLANEYANLYKYHGMPIIAGTWNKNRKFKTRVKFYSATNNVGTFWVISGWEGTSKHLGFKVVNGVLYGTVGNGAAETTVALETLGAGAYNETRLLELIWTAGSKAEFYVAGVKVDEITTNLPEATDEERVMMYLYVTNDASATDKTLEISEWKIYQEG